MGRTCARKKLDSIPEWLKVLPADAKLSREELARALGYCSSKSFEVSYYRGLWPEVLSIEVQRQIGNVIFGRVCTSRALYLVRDVRNLIRKIIKENKDAKCAD